MKALQLPTTTVMAIKQFVQADELPPELFERPYFVAPKDENQAKALAIMRKAMAQTNTLGIGEIAFSGREHLAAIGAPDDAKQKGLMLYLLRYEDELRKPGSVLAGVKERSVASVKEPSVASDELSLAKQLIQGSTSRFNLSAYKNDYAAAVKKLVEAKKKGRPLPEPERAPTKAKVVNIMDALRNSLREEKRPSKRIARKTSRPRRVA